MMPKTSVSPAAIRNSMTPNWRPFSPCSSTSSTLMGNEKGGAIVSRPPASARGPRLPLHRTLLVVGVLVVLEDRLLDLHGELTIGGPHGLQQIEVLDREVVDVVPVRTPGRLVVGFAHGGDHARLVREVTLDRTHRGVDQHDAVVALRTVERRRVAELLPAVGHVPPVRLVVQVGAPVTGLEVAERRLLDRGA